MIERSKQPCVSHLEHQPLRLFYLRYRHFRGEDIRTVGSGAFLLEISLIGYVQTSASRKNLLTLDIWFCAPRAYPTLSPVAWSGQAQHN